MKKIILMMIMMICFTASSFAEVQYYRTTAFATARVYNRTYVWGDWEKSSLTICMNLTTDVITIYSPVTQVYSIVSEGQSFTDNSGGSNVIFKVIDQDYDRGNIRLRIERNGNSQIYIDFADVAWVYNVIRTR